ncbi:MAG TPA: glycoside hydrolase family 1 [Anaerolinea thermolimosa]|uniref:beta-glucosidase n=1 Tax=Anaerolinea thermolimosa TaxID=229919 RepID=A0A3D1JFB4_9CHLR|nr:family 1 glycosylhydrolase [Anaerolinea thermolimosa]GAP07354.1 aryl-beta-glucosidase [Anaerolinea thermolimosa]HCE16915.1 glycoside hydrolase family 1 [Anaerolinea thermolimosa]
MMNEFPEGFLWGAATAAHQVEGNNINSDFWVFEHTPGTIFAEPSGDACDHYRLFRKDIQMLHELGLNAYRFSIEWARVEPEPGFISRASLYHYREVLETCHEYGVTPLVTLHHFTSPRWLMKMGGWESPETPARFAAYAEAVMRELGTLIPYVCTINEANIGVLLQLMRFNSGQDGQAPVGMEVSERQKAYNAWMEACARELNSTPERVKNFLFSATDAAIAVVKQAHEQAREAVKAVRPEAQVGITLALSEIQPQPGGEEMAARLRYALYEQFLPAMAGDDFIGVQNYTRMRVGPQGVLPNEEGMELTQMNYEFYPEALEGVIRMVAQAGKPMIVTENGIGTEDDSRRVEFIRRALKGVLRCLADGLDVRGYMYWSLLDNFEWMLGYRPKFGLVAVDRITQERTLKPSARLLGQIARQNRLVD